MKTLPAPISDAERAVAHNKHALLVRVMAVIVRAALSQDYVSANDVPEDIVEPEHRQGVASNAWNSLTALEIIRRVPVTLTNEALQIFGGRTMNVHDHAKGRWVAVYQLADRGLALAWARNNGVEIVRPQAADCYEQTELLSSESISTAHQQSGCVREP